MGKSAPLHNNEGYISSAAEENVTVSPRIRGPRWVRSAGAHLVVSGRRRGGSGHTVLTCGRRRRSVPAVVTAPAGVPCRGGGPPGRKVSPALRAPVEKHHAAGGACSETRVDVARQWQHVALLAPRLTEAE
ncbi:hypothetical protein NDU88_002065 [Pleurodeles waltl]|uniref:Uncharacterized protein n=1 Tax=Pleurodeles waltl TaxID=8319 RepID=A0AAV7NGK5_PLEWA|nr:hypothetical protein NDU88_002065 [Pleurodeles waltl]